MDCGSILRFTKHISLTPVRPVPHIYTTSHPHHLSVDDEAGPNLFKIDPAGHFLGYKACSAGVKEQEAANLLEKAFKKAADDGQDIDPIRTAISTFQTLLSADFKAEEIEVGVAARGARFQVLTTAEVEAHLVALAEAQ